MEYHRPPRFIKGLSDYDKMTSAEKERQDNIGCWAAIIFWLIVILILGTVDFSRFFGKS